jgi:anti-anti-sigma regulatory factor
MSSSHALPRELTVYTVSEFHPQCQQWLEALSGPCLDVQASDLIEVDAAGIQLLLSLRHALQRRQARLLLRQPSAGLLKACATLGVHSLLEPETEQGA